MCQDSCRAQEGTNCTGLSVERPGANATVAPQRYVPRTKDLNEGDTLQTMVAKFIAFLKHSAF